MDSAARTLTGEVISKIGTRTCYLDTWHPTKFGKRIKRNPRVDQFFEVLEAKGMHIKRTKIYPHYTPSTDTIYMPPLKQFKDTVSYYNTLCHEVIHLVGDDEYLARQTLGADLFTKAHGEEETVAEFGAMYFAQFFHYIEQTKKSSIAYINTWAKQGKFADDKALLQRLANRGYASFLFILNAYNELKENE